MNARKFDGMMDPALPNVCPRCGRHSTQAGEPNLAQRSVSYKCPFCGMVWSRDIEDDLYEGAIVRIDYDSKYEYGTVVGINGEEVTVLLDKGIKRRRDVERWRLVEY